VLHCLTACAAHGIIDQNGTLFTVTQVTEIRAGMVSTIEGLSTDFDAEMVTFGVITFAGFTTDSLAFMGSARFQLLADSITHKYSLFFIVTCGLRTFDLSF